MATTRQHLNETALCLSRLLGMITGMSDDEIDEIMDSDEVARLAKAAQDLNGYAAGQKFDQTTRRNQK
jgi:hypothetical protein